MAPHLFGHMKIYNMGVSISRRILPISHVSLKIGSHHSKKKCFSIALGHTLVVLEMH